VIRRALRSAGFSACAGWRTTGVVRKSSVVVFVVDDEDPNEIVPIKNRLIWTGTIMHRDAYG
jgi:hypothetical protein